LLKKKAKNKAPHPGAMKRESNSSYLKRNTTKKKEKRKMKKTIMDGFFLDGF